MRFSIDLIMLNKYDVIVGIRRNVRPWRAVICQAGTVAIIETNVNELDLQLGAGLELRSAPLRRIQLPNAR